MAILTAARVRLGAQADHKEEAIRLAGELLVRAGCVAPAYIDGMLRREEAASTFLGAGIAIPHGTFEDKALVDRTGIAFLQLPAGVEWEPGDRVFLVIAIAARSDEHVGLLQRLAEVAEDERAVRELIEATDPEKVVECLERPAAESASGN